MPTRPLFVCPICQPGTFLYAGTIVPKVCAVCLREQRSALTGRDRVYTNTTADIGGIDPNVRRIFGSR